jgi:cellulose synthase/poly-beta-1,6-N-acetylglucosamine synthase-like glycosyltransferase
VLSALAPAVFLCYFLVSAVLLLYAANAYVLVAACLAARARLRRRNAAEAAAGEEIVRAQGWPAVVTQIPLYNEIAVAERVIRAAAAMDYPRDRHHLQILDDSTDGTCRVVDAVVEELTAAGVSVSVLRRSDRRGFKAGALAAGLDGRSEEFCAIFDADFVPPRDFLLRTIPALLARRDAAWVQARWGHLNADDSLLTAAQALAIDGHFGIDQIARGGTDGWFMNFNGTAGVWRTAAIQDAGGWTADTLTEDLDLSYRAQMRGWRGIYLPDVVVPGELPADAGAFRSQQFRWAKGSVQTALKLAGPLFRSSARPAAKVQGWFHMTHYAIHPFILLFALVALPLAWLLPVGWQGWGWANVLIAVLSLAPSFFYAAGQWVLHPDWLRRLTRLPFLILAGIGLALSNSRAVAEAVTGKTSAFLRTPKEGSSGRRRYRADGAGRATGEWLAGGICLAAFALSAACGRALAAQFLLLAGLSFVFFALLCSGARRPRRAATATAAETLEHAT